MKAVITLSAATILAAFAFAAAPALAEQGPVPTAQAEDGDPTDDGWRYDTYYIYPLTRHINEREVEPGWTRWLFHPLTASLGPPWGHWLLYPITVTLDTVQLPFGALAGLFGE